ncbi:MAG: PorT family protein [Bacteroidales bacterium]|nr:PorT family protein [Bacteroidales bacterium]
MKKNLFLLLFIFFGLNCYSQINYEKGYIIFDNDEKLECLIKNIDWKNNPTEFMYKLTDVSEPQITFISEVKEFGVQNYLVYKKFIVQIDRSSDSYQNLSTNKHPELYADTLFLKQLVKGNGNLYVYEEGNLTRYFYNINNSEINQLIHKRYWVSKNYINENNRFRNQIWIDLKCESIDLDYIKKIEYSKNDLVKCFVKYNSCLNTEFIDFESLNNRKVINLSIRPGINISTLDIQNVVSNSRDIDFGSNYNFRFGIELEYILPYNKNKWALIVEPTYQYYVAENELTYIQTSVTTRTTNVKVDYKSVELPVSLRYYMYLNNNSRLFMNAGYTIDLCFDSYIKAERVDLMDLEINTRQNLVFGLGYNYKGRYSFEMRYALDREILGDYSYWLAKYNTFSIILGYNILGKNK